MIDVTTTDLHQMYEAPMIYKTIFELSESTLQDLQSSNEDSEVQELLEPIRRNFSIHGQSKRIKSQIFDEVCEREV